MMCRRISAPMRCAEASRFRADSCFFERHLSSMPLSLFAAEMPAAADRHVSADFEIS